MVRGRVTLTLATLDSIVKEPTDLYKVGGFLYQFDQRKVSQSARLLFQAVIDADEGLKALAAGRVDAVIYDAPIVRYLVHHEYSDELALLPVSLLPSQKDPCLLQTD